MYRTNATRERIEAAKEAAFTVVAEQAWRQCAAAAEVLMKLRQRAEFHALAGVRLELMETLPAMLAETRGPQRADAVLLLAVARATLRPWLARVDILGWLAHADPQGLVVLLNVATGGDGDWQPTGEPPTPQDPPPRRKRRTKPRR
ncbi:MAG: hypothetical protein ACTHOL_19645 [Luteibacter jiangsuensis]